MGRSSIYAGLQKDSDFGEMSKKAKNAILKRPNVTNCDTNVTQSDTKHAIITAI